MPNHHPNKPVLARPKISIATVLWSYWPFAAWVGVIFFCYWAHKQGVSFRRMNAAVDVYQENVSPVRDGFLEKIADGVTRGTAVKEGQIVAYLRSDELAEEKAQLMTEIELERRDKILDLGKDIEDIRMDVLKLRSEQIVASTEADAEEESAKVWEAAKTERIVQSLGSSNLGANDKQQVMARLKAIPDPEAQKALTNAAKNRAKAKGYTEAVKAVELVLDAKLKQKAEIEDIVIGSDAADTKVLELVAGQGQLARLKILEDRKKHLQLRATRSGLVDRINKDDGEFVKAGESVLKIVGEPTQIVAFLPQDQLTSLKEGQTVWITATHRRKELFESTISYLAPRLNTVPDSASPIPNRRLFGRDVVIAYPKNSGMMPGQTVIVHVDDPRNVPLVSEWINRIFSNDDLE